MEKINNYDETYDKFAELYNEILQSLNDENKSKLEDLFCILQEMKNNKI